jgi:hypothetical protein
VKKLVEFDSKQLYICVVAERPVKLKITARFPVNPKMIKRRAISPTEKPKKTMDGADKLRMQVEQAVAGDETLANELNLQM